MFPNGDELQSPNQQQNQQNPGSSSQFQLQTQNAPKKLPYVKITEQPAPHSIKFRYECEGRLAGSIRGVNYTAIKKAYPSIKIVGYNGIAYVVVSCVTKDQKPHPHGLVGKENCSNGVYQAEITKSATFKNLGIQCVKKKDVGAVLSSRRNPFGSKIFQKQQK